MKNKELTEKVKEYNDALEDFASYIILHQIDDTDITSNSIIASIGEIMKVSYKTIDRLRKATVSLYESYVAESLSPHNIKS
jgi:phage/plasmid-associated DNA primase